MPIYEYQCSACSHQLEKLQKISDPPLSECPACNQPSLKKLLSAAAFRLKGGGWYETDFKTGSRKNVHAESTGGDSGSPSSSASSGGDSVAPASSSKPDKSAVATD